jgi:endonuclease/exonuclease/phosphatase family metal-dependent hydrolase
LNIKAPEQTLRIVTYNVHECIGTDGLRSAQRILSVLKNIDADVVLLQELSNSRDDTLGALLLDDFARELDMHAFHGATLRRNDAEYGNACLTREPPAWTRMHDLSVAGCEPRVLLDIGLPGKSSLVRVLGTHLGLRRAERREQYRRIAATLADSRSAVVTVLAGDFNDLRLPRHVHQALPGPLSTERRRTFPSRLPALPLDRIHVWPDSARLALEVERGELARRASDHLPLFADIATGNRPDLADAGMLSSGRAGRAGSR